MVGDSLRADVAGAKCLDMLTVWKPKARLWREGRTALIAAPPSEQRQEELYLQTYIEQRAIKLQLDPVELQPDIIIEHLSELLEIFPGL